MTKRAMTKFYVDQISAKATRHSYWKLEYVHLRSLKRNILRLSDVRFTINLLIVIIVTVGLTIHLGRFTPFPVPAFISTARMGT